MSIPEYRLVRVDMSYLFFTDLFTHGEERHFKITKGLPKDVKVHSVYNNGDYGRVTFVLEHESFEDIAPKIPFRPWICVPLQLAVLR